MAMMQSYYKENFKEVTHNFLLNLSDVILELEYAELVYTSKKDKDHIKNIKEKISYILFTLKEIKNSLVVNPLVSDYQYISFISSFNKFFNRVFKIDDINFAITEKVASQLEEHLSNIENRLRELEKNIIFDPLIPYDLISHTEGFQGFQEFQDSKKKELASECKKTVVPINAEETKQKEYPSVDFGDDMPKQIKNFHILCKKFKSYCKKYLATDETSFNAIKNKFFGKNSCNLLCLDMIVTNKILNTNAIIFYAKNYSLMKKFINMYPHLEKLITCLENSENTKKPTHIEKIKKYLTKMLEVIKEMKLNELKISAF